MKNIRTMSILLPFLSIFIGAAPVTVVLQEGRENYSGTKDAYIKNSISIWPFDREELVSSYEKCAG